MTHPVPSHTVDISPEGRTLAAGSADDPTDDDVTAAAPVEGWLESLLINVGGEVGVKLERGGSRLFPAESRASEGYLFRSSWPPETPVGRRVREGEEVVARWRNVGVQATVEAAAVFVPRGR